MQVTTSGFRPLAHARSYRLDATSHLQPNRQRVAKRPRLILGFERYDLGYNAQPAFWRFGGFQRGDCSGAEIRLEIARAIAGESRELNRGEGGAVHVAK